MRSRPAPWIPVLVGALLGCVRMTSFDLPLMLACGDRLLDGAGVPHTNPFHWPHPDFPWLDDKWGFGLLCAAAHRAGGAAGLTALNAALGAAAGALVHAVARRRAGPWQAAGYATAAVALLSYRQTLRAEWISVLGVAWTLVHLDGLLAGSRRSAALVVAAVPLWAACHVYWVLAPAMVVVAALAARSARGAAWGAAAFAAGAVSPYGVANLAHPFRIAASAADLEGAITELRTPFLSGPITYLHVLAAAFAVVAGVRVVASWREGRRADAAVGALLVVAGLRFDRNLAFLAPAALAVAPRSADDAPARPARWAGWAAVPAVAGLLAGVAWLAPEKSLGAGWDERALPHRLAAALPPETRRHRYVNDFSVGSFLDWARGASFIDGNSHGWPAEHFATYRRALEGTVTVAEIDRRFPNDGWFLRTSAPMSRVLVVGLLLEGDYAPTDWDDVATLFRPVPDAERSDELWRKWLAGTYLPVARGWFPTARELLDEAGGPPAPDDAEAWRALLVRSPWDRAILDGLRAAYDRRRDDRQSARIWRLARRVPE